MQKPPNKLLLCEENTQIYCLPRVSEEMQNLPRLVLSAGEACKSTEQLIRVWHWLAEKQASRNTELIALGGGALLDLAGFVASTYKRGMKLHFYPTTLLAMVDASVGGKTAINLPFGKNLVGSFYDSDTLVLDPIFLESLPLRELKSGYAEMLKHALLSSTEMSDTYLGLTFSQIPDLERIEKSIQIKKSVVEQDPKEKGLRKILNLGHTFGHALEFYAHQCETVLLHGEAVAWGLVAELHLSAQILGLDPAWADKVRTKVRSEFPRPSPLPSLDDLRPYLLQDKKNSADFVSFSLLENPGQAVWDVRAEWEQMAKAWDFTFSAA